MALTGDPAGSPALTRWSIGESLVLGDAGVGGQNGVLVLQDATVAVGSVGTPGSVLLQPRGFVLAIGRARARTSSRRRAASSRTTARSRARSRSTGATTPTRRASSCARWRAPVAAQRSSPRARPQACSWLSCPRARPKPRTFFEGPIAFTGDAELGGTLVLAFRNGAAPRQGDAIRVLDVGGGVVGDFDGVVTQGLAPGASFDASVTGGALSLVSSTDTTALPAVSLKAKPKLKETKKGGAKVKVLRSGDRSAALLVAYAVGGTAESGADFEPLAGRSRSRRARSLRRSS